MNHNIKQICKAMAALAAAIPGTSSDRGSTTVSLHGCDDVTIRLLTECGGRQDTFENDAGTECWDCSSLRVGAINVVAYSKHRPLSSAETDPDRVSAALALAAEAAR